MAHHQLQSLSLHPTTRTLLTLSILAFILLASHLQCISCLQEEPTPLSTQATVSSSSAHQHATTSIGAPDTLPIIAIVTQPSLMPQDPKFSNASLINAEYVKWIEQSAARVLVLPYDWNWERIEMVLSQVQGVLFQGGETQLIDHPESPYLKTSLQIMDYAWKHSLPVWGTCLGFELFMVWAAKDPKIILGHFAAENIMLPLMFDEESADSRMFGSQNLDDSLRKILEQEPVTINLHHNGISRKSFNDANLGKTFRVLSFNYDLQGEEFISTVEAHEKPFYAVQFHPERNAYIQNPEYVANRGYDAMRSMRYFSDYFISEARRYAWEHSITPVPCCDSQLEKLLIHRHRSLWLADQLKEMYFFAAGSL